MSRLYDAAEPGVIDEDLLRQLVVEQGPEKEAGRIARVEGIEFTEVLEIRLDFKSQQPCDPYVCMYTLNLPNYYAI